jgi:tRNA(Ile)-lysidine synthase TilS/MesJ
VILGVSESPAESAALLRCSDCRDEYPPEEVKNGLCKFCRRWRRLDFFAWRVS